MNHAAPFLLCSYADPLALHTYELPSKYPDNPLYATILAEVYAGLSDDQALRLGSRHNINEHFIHKTTHRNYVSGNINIQRVTMASSVGHVGGLFSIKAVFDGERTSGYQGNDTQQPSPAWKNTSAVHSPS